MRLSSTDSIDYNRIRQIFRQRFENAADFTFVIVGNYDETKIDNLIETYIASLPATGARKERHRDVMPQPKKGEKHLHMKMKMQTPKTTVVYQAVASCPYTPTNNAAAITLQHILEMLYTEEIREKDGGTYGIGVQISLTHYPKNRLQLAVNLDTNSGQAESAARKIRQIVRQVAEKGPDPLMMRKSTEYRLKNHDAYIGTNDYWMQAIMQNVQYGTDDALDPAATLRRLTPATVQKLARLLADSHNTTLAILEGVKAE